MGIISRLLNFARKIVHQVMESALQQVNIVDNILESVVQFAAKTVMSGAWEGQAADKFVSELQGMVLPHGQEVSTKIKTMQTSLKTAEDLITAADDRVANIASDLAGVFAKVY